MTHSTNMPDSAGTFQEEEPAGECPQAHCPGTLMRSIWESSCGGYEDIRYRCNRCGHGWWVDGIDS